MALNLLCGQRGSWIFDPPASTFQMLRWQLCTTMPSLCDTGDCNEVLGMWDKHSTNDSTSTVLKIGVSKLYFPFVCVCACVIMRACVCAHVSCVHTCISASDWARRRSQVPWVWSYRMWVNWSLVLGTKLRSSKEQPALLSCGSHPVFFKQM